MLLFRVIDHVWLRRIRPVAPTPFRDALQSPNGGSLRCPARRAEHDLPRIMQPADFAFFNSGRAWQARDIVANSRRSLQFSHVYRKAPAHRWRNIPSGLPFPTARNPVASGLMRARPLKPGNARSQPCCQRSGLRSAIRARRGCLPPGLGAGGHLVSPNPVTRGPGPPDCPMSTLGRPGQRVATARPTAEVCAASSIVSSSDVRSPDP